MKNYSLTQMAPFLIILAAVLWGLDGILRQSLYSLPPVLIVFYEHLIGSLIIVPLAWPYLSKIKLAKNEWLAIIWISLVSGLLGTLWFTKALQLTQFIPFSVVFLLQKLQPIFAIATAHILLKEKLSSRYLFWAAVAVVGGYFLTFPSGRVVLGDFEVTQTIWAGIYAVMAAMAWGASTAVSRFALLKKPILVVTSLRFLLTTVWGFCAVLILGLFGQLLLVDLSQVSRLFVIAFSTGLVAMWLYYTGLARVQAKTSTVLELALPITAIGIDYFYFGKLLSPVQLVSSLVMLIAMYQVVKTSASKK